MKISSGSSINFCRKPSDSKDYNRVLQEGKIKAGNRGKSILAVPAASLPGKEGMGIFGSRESLEFFSFAKQYWGINEIQLLPVGRYHRHGDNYPIYSGTSMDLGSQMIDIQSFISESKYRNLIGNVTDKIDYNSVLLLNSEREITLRKLFESMDTDLIREFKQYKQTGNPILEQKGLYQALAKLHGSRDYKKWNSLDKNLFNSDIVTPIEREKRIAELHKLADKEIDFYKFKQFLADKSLKKAKDKLNSMGLKVNGDLICGFSYDEVWSNPKAFREGATIGWGLPALDLENPEAEKLLRQKVDFYAKRFDGIRIDASWTYIHQPHSTKDYTDKFLNIIDDEVKKIKGESFDLKNIVHEFAASHEDFNIYNGNTLKPYVKDRVKVYTSDWLSSGWGSNRSFLERGWTRDSFILGATNHDSKPIEVSNEQAKVLGEILKIPSEKLTDKKEFTKAKLAEPMSAYNNMLFFREALGMEGHYSKLRIPENYEKQYFDKLEKGEGFNPMDALEKSFKAQGLDKTEPKLYKKIVKYRKILEGKNNMPYWKYTAGILFSGIILFTLYKIYTSKHRLNKS